MCDCRQTVCTRVHELFKQPRLRLDMKGVFCISDHRLGSRLGLQSQRKTWGVLPHKPKYKDTAFQALSEVPYASW